MGFVFLLLVITPNQNLFDEKDSVFTFVRINLKSPPGTDFVSSFISS